jgi:hypothetical protein
MIFVISLFIFTFAYIKSNLTNVNIMIINEVEILELSMILNTENDYLTYAICCYV